MGQTRVIACERCGTRVEVSTLAAKAKYCPPCALEARREADRERQRHRRQKPRKEAKCVVCGVTFEIKKANSQPEACPDCRSKHYERNRPRRKIDPKKKREYKVKHYYGLSLDQLDKLTRQQGNKCAACGRSAPKGKSLSIDHDHECCEGTASCGRCVRGLLCQRCNSFLGLVDDNPSLIERMIDYIDAGGSPQAPNRHRLAGGNDA